MTQLFPWPLVATIAILRLALALFTIVVVAPWLMFPRLDEPEINPLVSRAVWMAFFIAATVHVLSGLRIYEAPVFLVACALLAMWNRIYRVPEEGRVQLRLQTVGWFYDSLDGRKQSAALLKEGAKADWRRRTGFWPLVTWAVLDAEFGAVAFKFFGQAFTTPVPPLSDAPVNLAWLKYIENNALYHGEIYPRGMYAVLSILRKFTWTNAVVLLDVAGPLFALTIVASIAFFVRKATKSWGAVAIAAAAYGLFPQFLPLSLGRLGAPNSEEFGLIFSLPAAWFLFAYLTEGRRGDRATAAAAAGMAAFTHPFPALLAIASMATVVVTAVFNVGLKALKRLPGAVAWVGAAGALAAMPPALAIAFGTPWHQSSVTYLEATVSSLPPANPTYVGAFGVSAALAVVLALLGRKLGPEAAALGAGAAVAAAGLGLFLAPHFGLPYQALSDRGGEMAAVSLAVAAGVSWGLVERVLGRFRPAGVLAAALVIGLVWYRIPPAGPDPYYYYTSEMIETYLRADETYIPGSWTLVTGFRGYSLALGRAIHMYPDGFLSMAKQMPKDIADWYEAPWRDTGGVTLKNKTPFYILMVERVAPLAPGEDSAKADPVIAESQRLEQWIQDSKNKLPLRPILSDSNIDVWTLELPIPEKPGDIFSPKPGPTGPIGR